jgi:O-antigen/teichoic acid export membrane protein
MSRIGALTSSRLLARNVAFNIAGALLPAIAAVAAVPLLVRGLGDARFGVLMLAWTAIGYFSLFDLGIGRALTHAIADRLGTEDHGDIGSMVRTSLGIVGPVGILGAVALMLAAPWIVEHGLQVPAELEGEAVGSIRVLAIAVPFTGMTAALRGVLEASQRFGTVNLLRVPFGLLTFLGPIAVLPFSRSVVASVTVLTVARVVLFVAHVAACRRHVPHLTDGAMRSELVRPLLSYGGWMTVSNIISPLMNTFDRFAIGAVLSVSMVTYYATPNELVTKMWLFTAALWPVVFPALATTGDRSVERTATLFDRALRLTFAGLVLPTFLLVLLAHEILGVWLGPAFAEQSSIVLQLLAVAVLINSVGQGAYTFIQAMGRPDLTGKYHTAELPVYALMLWFFLSRYGIVGVAIAWSLRAIADALLLMLTCPVIFPASRAAIWKSLRWLALAGPVIVASSLVTSTSARWWIAGIAIPLWTMIVWRVVLTEAERRAPRELLSAAWPRE